MANEGWTEEKKTNPFPLAYFENDMACQSLIYENPGI